MGPSSGFLRNPAICSPLGRTQLVTSMVLLPREILGFLFTAAFNAAHYIFEDESGNKFDFCRIEAQGFQFDLELPEDEVDSENQGFGINQDLQGKWFLLEYYKNVEPLYVDGPDGEVLVISKVTPVEE